MSPEEMGEALLPYLPKLLVAARYFVRNGEGARDLLQDTILKCMTMSAMYVDEGVGVHAWAVVVMRNLMYSERRRFLTRTKQHVAPTDDGKSAVEYLLYGTPATNDGPSRIRAREMHERFMQLDAKTRAILLLSVDGMKMHDIARMLGMEIGTIKSRLSRGRAAMRKDDV